MAKPIPDGYTSVTPSITVSNSAEALAFYAKAFGAVETMRLTMPGGGIAHCEFQIGNAKVMMADEMPDWGNKGPATTGAPTGGFCIYVPDCDAAFERAVAAGCTVLHPMADQFYGDRSGRLVCPFGHHWSIATHQKDMTPAEMQAAMDEWMKSM
jgi:PhnB protein